MKIERYSLVKFDINRTFVFYSTNDLLIPLLRILTKDFRNPNGLKIYFSSFKKGVVMDVFASVTLIEHEKMIKKLEEVIKDTFDTTFSDENDLIKLSKIRK
jgi:hypothetical protein